MQNEDEKGSAVATLWWHPRQIETIPDLHKLAAITDQDPIDKGVANLM